MPHRRPAAIKDVRPPGLLETDAPVNCAAMSQDDGPVLFCYDGSEGARRALTAGARLFPGRRSVVITVWQSPWHSVIAPPLAGMPADAGDQLDRAGATRARAERRSCEAGTRCRVAGRAAARADLADDPRSRRLHGRSRDRGRLARIERTSLVALGQRVPRASQPRAQAGARLSPR